MTEIKHIHFIGICGVAMSALAIAFQKAGYKVTGSDAGFYPPVSTNLEKNNIDFYPGWHPEKMVCDGVPEFVVVGNVAGSTNPELIYVKEKGIPYYSYPEVVAKYFVKDNSIVCAGTYGKTTTSMLLSWILTQANLTPSYMTGGLCINDFSSAKLETESKWSVLEGDEYKTSGWDPRPKFSLYNPTHLLLTSVIWDHADVYPTEKSYIEAFRTLINNVPKTGKIIGCLDGKNIHELLSKVKTPMLLYGKTHGADYEYHDVQNTKKGMHFAIQHKDQVYRIKSPMLGEYMAENICACFAMAHQIGVPTDIIIKGIASFQGIKRRLEKRLSGSVTVFDDIAHSPTKAIALLNTIRKIYDKKIIVVFEPNIGNRKREAIPQYDNAFQKADMVFIPRLTKLKKNPNDSEPPMEGNELTKVISKTHPNVRFIEDDRELIQTLIENTSEGDVLLFLGSHGFRGMIEEVVLKLEQKKHS